MFFPKKSDIKKITSILKQMVFKSMVLTIIDEIVKSQF